MNYELTDENLIFGINNLNRVSEDIEELNIYITKELDNNEKEKFETELTKILKYLEKLKYLSIYNITDKNYKFDIDLNKLILNNIEKIIIEGIDLSNTDLNVFLKKYINLDSIDFNNCNISNINFLKNASNKLKEVNLYFNPISSKFADDILRLRGKFNKFNILGCNQIIEEFANREIEFSEFLTKNKGKLDGNQFYEAFEKALFSRVFTIKDMQQLSQYIDFFSDERKQGKMIIYVDDLENYDDKYIEDINLFALGDNKSLVLTPKIVEKLKGKISKDINIQLLIENIGDLSFEEIEELAEKYKDENIKIKYFPGGLLVLTPQIAEKLKGKLLKKNKILIKINNASELSLEQIKKLEEEYNIEKVILNDLNQSLGQNQKFPYNLLTYKRCREVIDKLLDGINKNINLDDPNREKKIFGQVIKRLAKHINYNYEHADRLDEMYNLIKIEEERRYHKSEEIDEKIKREKINNLRRKYFDMKTVIKSRNMEGGLLENTAVCEGYAEIVRNVFNCCGIEARYVSGRSLNEKIITGHAWNQIRLDGIWYNMDLTCDRNRILGNQEPKYLLKSDLDFEKTHGIFDFKDSKREVCPQTLPINELMKYINSENYRDIEGYDYERE